MLSRLILVGLVIGLAFTRTGSAAEITQWDGIYTKDQAARGKLVYEEHCGICHGEKLEGIDMAPALVGREFNNNWNRLKLGILLDRMSKSMPQATPGSLDMTLYADVLAFILSQGSYPAGDAELPASLNGMSNIRFVARKPEPSTP